MAVIREEATNGIAGRVINQAVCNAVMTTTATMEIAMIESKTKKALNADVPESRTEGNKVSGNAFYGSQERSGTTIAPEFLQGVNYRDRIYSVESLQQRLRQEMDRLEGQLNKLTLSPIDSPQLLANTYRDMIKTRKELLESLE